MYRLQSSNTKKGKGREGKGGRKERRKEGRGKKRIIEVKKYIKIKHFSTCIYKKL